MTSVCSRKIHSFCHMFFFAWLFCFFFDFFLYNFRSSAVWPRRSFFSINPVEKALLLLTTVAIHMDTSATATTIIIINDHRTKRKALRANCNRLNENKFISLLWRSSFNRIHVHQIHQYSRITLTISKQFPFHWSWARTRCAPSLHENNHNHFARWMQFWVACYILKFDATIINEHGQQTVAHLCWIYLLYANKNGPIFGVAFQMMAMVFFSRSSIACAFCNVNKKPNKVNTTTWL